MFIRTKCHFPHLQVHLIFQQCPRVRLMAVIGRCTSARLDGMRPDHTGMQCNQGLFMQRSHVITNKQWILKPVAYWLFCFFGGKIKFVSYTHCPHVTNKKTVMPVYSISYFLPLCNCFSNWHGIVKSSNTKKKSYVWCKLNQIIIWCTILCF